MGCPAGASIDRIGAVAFLGNGHSAHPPSHTKIQGGHFKEMNMHAGKGLKIGKCIEKMKAAQSHLPPDEQLDQAELMKAAKVIDELGALGPNGDIIAHEAMMDRMPPAGMLVVEVEGGYEEDDTDEVDVDAADALIQQLRKLHEAGVIEIKEKSLLDHTEQRDEILDRKEEIMEEKDELKRATIDMAKRFFS